MNHWPKQSKDEALSYRIANPQKMLINSAKDRAKKNDIPFDITEADVEIPEVCPYLKTPFVRGTMYAASVDRIDPRLGYVKGNIEVISRKANLMKNNASTEELLEFAYTILERN